MPNAINATNDKVNDDNIQISVCEIALPWLSINCCLSKVEHSEDTALLQQWNGAHSQTSVDCTISRPIQHTRTTRPCSLIGGIGSVLARQAARIHEINFPSTLQCEFERIKYVSSINWTINTPFRIAAPHHLPYAHLPLPLPSTCEWNTASVGARLSATIYRFSQLHRPAAMRFSASDLTNSTK